PSVHICMEAMSAMSVSLLTAVIRFELFAGVMLLLMSWQSIASELDFAATVFIAAVCGFALLAAFAATAVPRTGRVSDAEPPPLMMPVIFLKPSSQAFLFASVASGCWP